MDDDAQQKKVIEENKTFIFNADQIKFGDDLDSITQYVDVDESEQRFELDKQIDDLLDDILSTIPTSRRTDLVKNNIHKMIQRYKELRSMFSVFDEKGHATLPKTQGSQHKPVLDELEKMKKQLYWALPVVKNIKKIYYNENNEEETNELLEIDSDDITTISFYQDKIDELAIMENYGQNTTSSENNKYSMLQKDLNRFYTPFNSIDDTMADNIIVSEKVNTNITAIVDNLENFYSSVKGTKYVHEKNKQPIFKKRFTLQCYNTGTTGLEVTKIRGEDPIINRKNLTQNDMIQIKSLITLPEPTVRFSKVNLPNVTILEKANLNKHFLNYWKLLKDNTKFSTTTISNINKQHNYEADGFLKKIRNFKLVEDTFTQEEKISKDKYRKFLDTVIPTTHYLFNMIKPFLKGQLSIHDILSYLEPFLIYQSDLSFMQYKEMNQYITDKISEYRKKYTSMSREYGNMKGTQSVLMPSLIRILDQNASLRDKVLDVYKFTNSIMQMSNSEFMKRIIELDGGVFYYNAVAIISTDLMIADGSREIINTDVFFDKLNEKNASATAANSKTATAANNKTNTKTLKDVKTKMDQCNQYKSIAKRYIDIDELQEDNNQEIYFDKNMIQPLMISV